MPAAVILINSTAMGNRGRLIAPGGLRDDLAAVAEDEPAAGESLAEMAAQYGLRPSSARPRLVFYLVKVWQRRHFILAYATARNVSMYTEARLGQLWQVLTPLLNLRHSALWAVYGRGILCVPLTWGSACRFAGAGFPGRTRRVRFRGGRDDCSTADPAGLLACGRRRAPWLWEITGYHTMQSPDLERSSPCRIRRGITG